MHLAHGRRRDNGRGISVTALWPASTDARSKIGTARTHNRECGSQPAHQSLITDVLQFRLHPCAIIHEGTVRESGSFLMPKALTTDIRAAF
ncbi:hypothetical protein AJ87_10565 [Rhizobium yanglingense]|nr:hypothetical protein AJ87_10565 [Rhizobium yanglingense]